MVADDKADLADQGWGLARIGSFTGWAPCPETAPKHRGKCLSQLSWSDYWSLPRGPLTALRDPPTPAPSGKGCFPVGSTIWPFPQLHPRVSSHLPAWSCSSSRPVSKATPCASHHPLLLTLASRPPPKPHLRMLLTSPSERTRIRPFPLLHHHSHSRPPLHLARAVSQSPPGEPLAAALTQISSRPFSWQPPEWS